MILRCDFKKIKFSFVLFNLILVAKSPRQKNKMAAKKKAKKVAKKAAPKKKAKKARR